MTFIDLDRRFIHWTRDERGDPEFARFVDGLGTSMGWTDLRARRRVVILAEAGSGKTTELQEQARLVKASGGVSFYVTVQNIGKKGTDRALGHSDYNKLQAWRASTRPAWFFLDSVDEAKKADVRLSDVLKEFADNIAGAEARAHLVLSGRHSDWEFRRDLEALNMIVPLPTPDSTLADIDPNKALIAALYSENKKTPEKPEEPLVVLMAAFDRKRVELFAREKGVPNVNAFLSALDEGELWDFARRPTDLDWLVSFWRKNGGFGSLAEMLDLSLRERLKENNPERARKDNVDEERALAALNRIGAALVLQRLDTIEIPDSSLKFGESVPALALDEILPDWSGTDQSELSLRPVFDPASAGFIRLHNDNEGTVRGYLAARWLHKLRSANCPWSAVSNLLFATTYDQRLVKPSMRVTAAWLALWEPDVAQGIIDREPQLLLSAGDPASLPLETRRTALAAVIKSIDGESSLDILDRDALKRFASPDMASFVREQWEVHAASPTAREFLLRIIWLGKLRACTDIATAASFNAYQDYYTQIFSGRALMATAPRDERRRYIRYLVSNNAALPVELVWNAIEELFPTDLSISDLLALLRVIDLEDTGAGLGLSYYGPKIVAQLTTVAEVTELINGLMEQLEARTRLLDDNEQPRDELYLETIEVAGNRLFELSPNHEAPMSAIDAALRIGESRRHRSNSRQKNEPSIFERLQQSPSRRRSALWRATQLVRAIRNKPGAPPVTAPWNLEILGLHVALRREDVDWLLEDLAKTDVDDNQKLAANALMTLWKQENEDLGLLARIRSATADIPIANQIISDWLTPNPPSPEEQEIQRKWEQRKKENSEQMTKRNQTWIDFAESLRTNPGQLRALTISSKAGVDPRLYNTWLLLSKLSNDHSHHAIRDLSPLLPIIGEFAVNALRDAFIAHWRHWKPTLKWERPEAERNHFNKLDCIGIVGVTQESLANPTWAERLSPDEAALAAEYATLELNGFPDWLDDLAKQHPMIVANTLLRYAETDLTPHTGERRHDAIEQLSRASDVIVKIIATKIFELVRSAEDPPLAFLDPALRILRHGHCGSEDLLDFALRRFAATKKTQCRASYFALAYTQDPERAATTLMASLDDLDDEGQMLLVQTILPQISDSDFSLEKLDMPPVPFASAERLIWLAFSKIHPSKDNEHNDGVYSPDVRDHAESARDALFRSFIETPGLATYEAIGRMIKEPSFPIPPKRLRKIAARRAGIDSEMAPWTSDDVKSFEADFKTVPSTPADLQHVAIGRLEDLQHLLINGDFNQGLTVARLEAEVDVQNWLANALYNAQGRSYSLEREPHVAEEKEPDIRLQAKVSNASCPIEIKVAESWSVKELEEALTVQLRDRYLRDRDNRWGILLLVHQKARKNGWQHNSQWLKFEELVEYLRALARRLAAEEPLAPQMAVCTIDVSRVRR